MDYRATTSIDDVRAYLDGADIVAFDFETAPEPAYRGQDRAALDAHRAHIVGVSLSVAEWSALYIPLRHVQGGNADPAAMMDCLRAAVFENRNIVKVAHNLAFEAMFLYARGIVVQAPCHDTMAAAQLTLKGHMAYRGMSDSGLKLLARTLFDANMPDFDTVTGGRQFDEMHPADFETIRYACADADYTLRLYHRFNAWFEKHLPRHRAIVERVESPTAVYCGMMKYNGLPVDTEAMRNKKTEAAERKLELNDRIKGMIGAVDIGANASTTEFKNYLFNVLKLPVLKTTATNREAADDETMQLLTEWCAGNRTELIPLFEAVQEYRRLGKIATTYIDGYLRFVSPVTGRIHPDLLPLGTATGRFAARNPNMQNCPRKDNDPVGVRNFIVAPEGKVLLSLDFSQIELRVGAFFCRDARMLETYRRGGDIHAQTTAIIYGIPIEQAADKNAPRYKERRTIGKACNFGVFFGLYAKGLQRNLRFRAGLSRTLDECETIIRNLKSGYPRLARWQEETTERARHRRYSETWAGRRRYLPGIASEDWARRGNAERQALNTPIQGTAADILKLALGRIVAGLPERPWLRPLLQIHDELVFELPADRVEEAVAFVKACMEAQPFRSFDVPVVAEASAGTNFGDMRELEDCIPETSGECPLNNQKIKTEEIKMAARATKKKEVRIEIPEIVRQHAIVRIVGTSPLVVHQFSEKSKRMMFEKQTKAAKSGGKEAKNPVEDFMQAAYWLTDMPAEFTEEAFGEAVENGARFGFPAVAIKASAASGAYRLGVTKDKVSVHGAFHIDCEILEIKGAKPVMREDTVRLATGVADLRYRPAFAAGWYMDVPISFISTMYTLEQILTFLNLGGFAVGIGEYRIEKGGQWGAYTVTGSRIVENDAA
jgi:DNA polymerase-1